MKEEIYCLIVDDEPIARDIIQSYCSHLANLKIIASCGNALEAKMVIENQPIDIMFLDINMPVLNGIAFLKTLKMQPQVIFTTAYKEYAIDAFDLSAVDYLLKPFSIERFIIAVDKALASIHKPIASKGQANPTPVTKAENHLFIKTDKKIYKILHDELLFVEASGNYIKLVTTQGNILTAMTFSGFEELLPKELFIRLHRSFIINKNKITHLEGNRAFINNFEIPIGNNYKDDFIKRLGL